MATHCSILDWRILWTEEPGGPGRLAESDTTEATLHAHVELLVIELEKVKLKGTLAITHDSPLVNKQDKSLQHANSTSFGIVEMWVTTTF